MVRVLTRENGVIAVCIVAAFVIGGLIDTSGTGPEWLPFAVVLGVGVVVPVMANEWLDRRD
jgi:hypothetical protein